MYCPKIGKECIEEECIAFKRGVMFSLPDASILIAKVLGKDFPISNIPLCILLDLGVCTEYDRIIDDKGLVKKVNELIND